MAADPSTAVHDSTQTLIDGLSVALGRPVLLDDPALAPLAYSRQWGDIDVVRSESILSRGATAEVREALMGQGIAEAPDVMRTTAVAELGMAERVCLPVRRDGRLLGYIWLLDPEATVTDADLDRLRRTAGIVGELLARSAGRPVADEGPLLAALASERAGERDQALADARARGLLLRSPVVVCLLAARGPGLDPTAVAADAARRLSAGYAIVGGVGEGAALVASLLDPVLATLPHHEVATWLHVVARADIAVGQSGEAAGLEALPGAMRQARTALRVAVARPATEASVAWTALGADRLVAQLPDAAEDDVPEALAHLIREEPALAATLAAFLDAGGDIKATATALALHRSGLYYRLHRIEELTGLRLHDGDDRLLAHLALRLARLR